MDWDLKFPEHCRHYFSRWKRSSKNTGSTFRYDLRFKRVQIWQISNHRCLYHCDYPISKKRTPDSEFSRRQGVCSRRQRCQFWCFPWIQTFWTRYFAESGAGFSPYRYGHPLISFEKGSWQPAPPTYPWHLFSFHIILPNLTEWSSTENTMLPF